jgi:hypothetical protein
MHQDNRKYGQGWTHQSSARTRKKYIRLYPGLTELYEAERDLMYEAEKNSFKKIVTPPPLRRERQYLSKQELGPFKVPTYFNRP